LSASDREARIFFENVPTHFLSALRRSMMEEVPTMAIDSVIIVENTSVIHDEVLAHRLAMVPLTSEKALEKYRSPEECANCVDCAGCFARLHLEAKNDLYDELVVYSGDMKPEDPDVVPVEGKIPLVVLGRGQSLSLEAEARLGRGKEHIKWSPVTVAAVVSAPYLKFDLTSLSAEEAESCLSCISEYSRELAEEVKRSKRGLVKVPLLRSTALLKYCEAKKCGEAARVVYSEKERILFFETTGSLSASTTLLLAINELKRKLRRLESLVEVALSKRKREDVGVAVG